MIFKMVLVGGLMIPTFQQPTLPIQQISEIKPIKFETVKSKYEIELDQERKRKKRLERIKKERIKAAQKVEHSDHHSWHTGQATSYYAGENTMEGGHITATGYDLHNGIYYQGYRVIAAAKSIPLGTLIDIKLSNGSILHCIVLDRGGAITENKFDVTQVSNRKCVEFGRKKVEWKIKGRLKV